MRDVLKVVVVDLDVLYVVVVDFDVLNVVVKLDDVLNVVLKEVVHSFLLAKNPKLMRSHRYS